MHAADFDFHLPDDRIALRPPSPRGSGKLLHVQPGATEPFTDREVTDLPQLLRAGDVLVLNDTKVIPAQLHAIRQPRDRETQGARVGITLHQRLSDGAWRAFIKPAKRVREGDTLFLPHAGSDREGANAAAHQLIVREKGESGEATIAAAPEYSLDQLIHAHGQMPLPPYIASRRPPDAQDAADYQTVFAARDGAVAAPTASLHLTQTMLDKFAALGVMPVFLTLHVGAGTFLPLKTDDPDAHVMHGEWGELSAEAAAAINEARRRGGRIVACGTTALRLLETAASTGEIRPFQGETSIFIKPGHRFRAADLLITNFHLPRSTLFMLVAAFSGLSTMQAAYAHAIRSGYMFYSYGDTSLLHRANAA